MDEERSQTRRRFLQLSSVATLGAVAGCAGSAPTGESTATESTATGEPTHGDGGHGEGTTDSHGTKTETESGDGHGSEDGHGDSHGSSLSGPSKHAEVVMKKADGGYHFSPHVVWVETGGTVTFTNESGSHSATAYAKANDKPQRIPDGAKAWDSGVLSKSGATFEQTFETAGVYDYFCIPHESLGMVGSIIVGEPKADGQPGLESPSGDHPEKVQKKLENLNEKVSSALGGH